MGVSGQRSRKRFQINIFENLMVGNDSFYNAVFQKQGKSIKTYPIGSMYGIFTNMWLIFMVFMYVSKYTSPMDPMGINRLFGLLSSGKTQELTDLLNTSAFLPKDPRFQR